MTAELAQFEEVNEEELQQPTGKVCSMLGFDSETFEGKKKLFNAMSVAKSLNDAELDEVELKGILTFPGTRTDPVTAAKMPATNTILVTDDGAYFSQSDGIAKCAMYLMAAFGGQFPEDALRVKFIETQLDKKKTLKQFELV